MKQETPMGVSQWLEHGKKYGYVKYWLDEETIIKMFEESMLDGDSIDDCGDAMISASYVLKEFILPTFKELSKE